MGLDCPPLALRWVPRDGVATNRVLSMVLVSVGGAGDWVRGLSLLCPTTFEPVHRVREDPEPPSGGVYGGENNTSEFDRRYIKGVGQNDEREPHGVAGS